ncbi:uncharacterized protein [Lolium perenne]|uniref:uncharacterized protein isoform X3 n=1 Tax=Lolium perenne TaxID=4522 RepID=UPI0021F64843|nr:uncharacterized protein LOC127295039 isoform X2 [Lolium perenne]
MVCEQSVLSPQHLNGLPISIPPSDHWADVLCMDIFTVDTEGRRPPLPADANDGDAAARFELLLSFISSPVLMCSSIPVIPRSPPPLVMRLCRPLLNIEEVYVPAIGNPSAYKIRYEYLFLQPDYWIVFAPKTDVVPYRMQSVRTKEGDFIRGAFFIFQDESNDPGKWGSIPSGHRWSNLEFLLPFGRVMSLFQKGYIHELDEKALQAFSVTISVT